MEVHLNLMQRVLWSDGCGVEQSASVRPREGPGVAMGPGRAQWSSARADGGHWADGRACACADTGPGTQGGSGETEGAEWEIRGPGGYLRRICAEKQHAAARVCWVG